MAAKRFVDNPASDANDRAILRRQFEIWAANDAVFQTLAQGNMLLAEALPVSKDLAALGEAGLKLLDYLTPAPVAAKSKKLSSKDKKAEAAALAAKQEWVAQVNVQLTRLAQPARRGQPLPADVRLAAYRPIKVLADAIK